MVTSLDPIGRLCIHFEISRSCNGDAHLIGLSRYIPQFPAAPLRRVSIRFLRETVPTKLIAVAESPRRSAMGLAINPNEYPVPAESDLANQNLYFSKEDRYTMTEPAYEAYLLVV